MDKIAEVRAKLQKKLAVEDIHTLIHKRGIAEKWLHANWDRLWREGKDETALKALRKYELLCDRIVGMRRQGTIYG